MPGLTCPDEVLGVVVAPGAGVVVLFELDPAADEPAMRCASCRCSAILLPAFCTVALKSASFALAARSPTAKRQTRERIGDSCGDCDSADRAIYVPKPRPAGRAGGGIFARASWRGR